MISPATYNITCYQGATFQKTFTVEETGVPIDWTGYTASMKVRRYPSAEAVLELTSGDGITLGGVAGTIEVEATAVQTGAIEAGNYVYDLELAQGAYVIRMLMGKFIVSQEVTYA